PVSLTLDPKLFGVDSMNYIAKADISTLPKPDISTLPLQGGQFVIQGIALNYLAHAFKLRYCSPCAGSYCNYHRVG
ncbi:hypothetical protein, partial [Telluria aromaticivorans]|uniref:hypothetical protein n=1 Tax=Telluria aromaticivorans TaxID=2725995 RepID=UPI001BB130F8